MLFTFSPNVEKQILETIGNKLSANSITLSNWLTPKQNNFAVQDLVLVKDEGKTSS
jgi:hypothetical protein